MDANNSELFIVRAGVNQDRCHNEPYYSPKAQKDQSLDILPPLSNFV